MGGWVDEKVVHIIRGEKNKAGKWVGGWVGGMSSHFTYQSTHPPTYLFHRLSHLHPNHNHRQAAAAESRGR